MKLKDFLVIYIYISIIYWVPVISFLSLRNFSHVMSDVLSLDKRNDYPPSYGHRINTSSNEWIISIKASENQHRKANSKMWQCFRSKRLPENKKWPTCIIRVTSYRYKFTQIPLKSSLWWYHQRRQEYYPTINHLNVTWQKENI